MEFETLVEQLMNSLTSKLNHLDLTASDCQVLEDFIRQAYTAGFESVITKKTHQYTKPMKIYRGKREIGTVFGVHNLAKLMSTTTNDISDVTKGRRDKLKGFKIKYC
jgi:hypothetical protein